MSEEEVDAHLLGIALVTQYNIKKGRELFGQKADDVILKEPTEIDSFETYQPLHADSLTEEQKRKARYSFSRRNGMEEYKVEKALLAVNIARTMSTRSQTARRLLYRLTLF